jgi:hypothetical protein
MIAFALAASMSLPAPAPAAPELAAAFQSAKLLLPPKGCGGELKPGPWKASFEKACAKGVYSPADGMIPATLGLERQDGSRQTTHLSNYLNLWGGVAGDGLFYAYEAGVVSEDWVLQSDGLFHIDQWGFTLETDGAPRSVRHSWLVENLEGRVFDSGGHPAELGDAVVKAKLEELRLMWDGLKR